MILIDPSLIGHGKFCAVCRLALEKMQDNQFFQGKRPKTVAYAIASNVLDFYYDNSYYRPITKRDMAIRIGKKSITLYSNVAIGSKERYVKFQQDIAALLEQMKQSTPFDFN